MIQSKQHKIQLISSILLLFILLLSGCTDNQKPYKEEIQLPNVHDEDLASIQQTSYSWFIQRLNPKNGFLESSNQSFSLTDQLFAGNVLAALTTVNTSFSEVLQHNINTIVRTYEDNISSFNLSTSSLLLDLIYQTPDETSNPILEQEIATQILSYYVPDLGFNTTPILSIEAAYALNALAEHQHQTNNQSLSSNISALFKYYSDIIKAIELTAEQKRFLPWFTPSFSLTMDYNLFNGDYDDVIHSITSELIQKQEKSKQSLIGSYDLSDESKNDISYQIQSLHSMMQSYTLSKQQNDNLNQTQIQESLILGLIYLKNNILTDNETMLTPQQHLIILPVIQDIMNALPEGDWSYVWDASTQTLIEGKTLQTSPALWTALTIGVMGSIGLLALVFIIINLYKRYKNQ